MKIIALLAAHHAPSGDHQAYGLQDGRLTAIAPHTAINPLIEIAALRAQGIQVVCALFDKRRSVHDFIQAGIWLRRIAQQEGAALVHALWGSSTALLASLFSPVPVVVSLCGSDVMGSYDEQGRYTGRGLGSALLSQWSLLHAQGVIAKSQGLKAQLWRQSSCHVIPNGVDLTRFKPMAQRQARRALGIDEEALLVLFVMRHQGWVKNQPLAEAAMRIVRQELPQATLYVVQDVNFEQMPEHLNAADVLLVTSHHEGSNNSIKQAMACNVPVISTDCGDARERLMGVSHSGVVSAEPHAIARHLITTLKAKSRSNGRQMIAPLSQEKIAARIVQFYEEVLAQSASHA